MLAMNANAGLFEDDEARKAIIDLRQKVDVSQQRVTEAKPMMTMRSFAVACLICPTRLKPCVARWQICAGKTSN
jgi:hypothetical protein